MFLDLGDNHPDTPRVPQAFTRLERLLMVAVAYQALLLSYLLAPDSFWAKPVRELLSSEPIRYVHIEPLVDRTARPKPLAPPSDLDRRSMSPEPVPSPANEDPVSRGNTPEKVEGGPVEVPRAAEPPTEAPSQAARIPGGILGNALRNLQRYVQEQNYDNPEGGGAAQGPDIQFDSKGIDFGPWLRRFRAQVYRNWLIPQAAMVMHGHVVIQMAVLRNGTLAHIRIVRPSGIEAFDSAAITALRLSNPTMPLPQAYPGDAIDPFTVTFYYNERIQ